ncbi:MAG: DNA recombination protein RmuC, partial [Rhodospirillales bacterium]|nr:DNA recombination protein RmuC [Rhodospirillales bacterium]
MDPVVIIAVVAIIAVIIAAAAVFVALRAAGGGNSRNLEAAERLAANQAELAGRLTQLNDNQGQIIRTLEERLEAVSKRLGDGLTQHTDRTGESMKQLHERLAVIDAAQKNLTDLSTQMVGLQDILSNKQSRGAFGEFQLNDIVSNLLPPSAYELQATLSNGKRVDCLLSLPNPPGAIAIDAKFPLESYRALHTAKEEPVRIQAAKVFATDVGKHVRDISEKYILPGETAEWALMFLPSEAVYAELHANHGNIVENAFRLRVGIVSPTTLMATLNTVRAILKDARMREQAGLIQKEVQTLLEDVARLDGRVESLQKHFDQAARDIDQIGTSSRKISGRGEKIMALELADDTPAA